MPFIPNPLMPGPLNMAKDIMNYTRNPHLESSYNPITARDTIGQPIRDRVFERDTIGQPILGSYVTSRTTTGYPITTPVNDLTYRPIYNASNLGDRFSYMSQEMKRSDDMFNMMRKRDEEERRAATKRHEQKMKEITALSNRIKYSGFLGP